MGSPFNVDGFNIFPTELILIGLQKTISFENSKMLNFIFMTKWNDGSELLIYRNLKHVRSLLQGIFSNSGLVEKYDMSI